MKNTFLPDYAISPGTIIEEYLKVYSLKKVDLIKLLELSMSQVEHLLNGKRRIDKKTAYQLQILFRLPAYVWLRLDSNYVIDSKRLNIPL